MAVLLNLSTWKMKDRKTQMKKPKCVYKSGKGSQKPVFWLVFDQIDSVIHCVLQLDPLALTP